MQEEDFQASLQWQRRIRENASQLIRWRDPLRLDNPKARFPGFRQRIVHYRKGQCVSHGTLPLPEDLVLHESSPMTLRDGTKLYSDIFLPPRFESLSATQDEPVPAIIAWSPYGKQGGTTHLDDFPFRAGVPKEALSDLQKWEGPDPALWCSREYAVINVDSRGAYTSEGDLFVLGHQEAEDCAEFITWVSEQPWCSGKVALCGNSWLSIIQWRVGSINNIREGLMDQYRDMTVAGGIPFYGFHEDVIKGFSGPGRLEDLSKYVIDGNDTWDDYWEDKRSHPERIIVPCYVTASWTNPVHTPGTFRAWSLLPDKTPKWLRVHNTQEWPDFYDDANQRDLLRFFDFYLHGKHDNGWDQTPRVRLSVLNLGMSHLNDTINRPEAEFPLSRTRYTKYFLSEKSLSLEAPSTFKTVAYDSATGSAVFWMEMPEDSETTGFFKARLMMSCDEHDEMDVYVQVERFSSARKRKGTLCMKPHSGLAQLMLQYAHDWQFGLSKVGMAFHWGPSGQLRASHALAKDEENSTEAQPDYNFDKKVPLTPGEVRALDIPLRPYGLYWKETF
ncbi:hypothetical protein BFJ63_vAg17400 [Fusarium oxysporum f. sp. narcissi]|uniref:Xaa-Pro dipeptidyl-peptidase C-terminal domain-containing protein n=1 Tax=Fusarium oxysporum f. sp. narcissi TaxID=451672 RepID=A0A4Q2V5Z1_FUSOX|nr:hypothetical protein BFJ63_vAg17400 [Fusarium oxysporum f. sp. narcissi]